MHAIPLAKVTWTKNGGALPSKHKINGTDLVLSEDSSTSDSGRYTCTATNSLGRDAAYSVITYLGEFSIFLLNEHFSSH